MNMKCTLNRSKERGFTLLEVLIVIVILGILAALAIPVFSGAKEKAVIQEAYQNLGAVNDAQQRYRAANPTFADTYGKLGFDPGTAGTGMTKHFSYAAPTTTDAYATTYSVVATRITTVEPLGASAYTVTVDQAGAISDTL